MRHLDIGEEEYKILASSLSKVRFFEGLSVKELDSILDSVHLYDYEAGDFIFKQGERADALYLVYQGRCEVLVKKGFFSSLKKVGTLDSNDIFGEMALISKKGRSATVKASSPSKIFVLLKEDVDQVVQNNPNFAHHMKRIIDQRKFENRRGNK